jgi:hypothetical protein
MNQTEPQRTVAAMLDELRARADIAEQFYRGHPEVDYYRGFLDCAKLVLGFFPDA